MRTGKLRVVIPLAIMLVAGVGFVAHTGFGTLSAIGWSDISMLCPIGALGTMLASNTVVPRALVSLLLAIVGVVLLGRFACAWICPIPVFKKLRGITKPRSDPEAGDIVEVGVDDLPARADDPAVSEPTGQPACGQPSNSRFLILGGALLSTAIFGFPVFCLVCPIGLSFAFIFVLIMLFGSGDVTWSAIAIPAALAIEVVFFRKWCSHICPVSAFMSLFGRFNRTFKPSIDDGRCIETSRGLNCGRCHRVCEIGIDPRRPESGTSFVECTRCRECLESCPGKAITFPFTSGKLRPSKTVSNTHGTHGTDDSSVIASSLEDDVHERTS